MHDREASTPSQQGPYGRSMHGKARTLVTMGKHDDAWKIAGRIKQMIENGGSREQYWEAYHYLAGYIKFEN